MVNSGLQDGEDSLRFSQVLRQGISILRRTSKALLSTWKRFGHVIMQCILDVQRMKSC